MKKGILLAAAILLSAAGFAQAQEGELSGSANLTFLSSYIWRGYDWYRNNGPAVQLGMDLNFYDTGFGLSIVNTRALKSGNGFGNISHQNLERIDLTLSYNNNLFEGQQYATDYKLGWVYYNFPDSSSNYMDMQELFLSLSWPEMCPRGIVPSYTIVCLWPSESNSWIDTQTGGAGGWLHIVGVGYDWTIPGFVPETPEQILHLSADLVYNDGVFGADHDWSHGTLGVSTMFNIVENLTLTPGLYYQVSMDDSVNDKDEFWVSLGLSYKF